jgi:hypothetical protein
MYGTSTHSHSVDASMLCQPLWREGRRDAAQRVRPLLRRQGLLRNRCATAGARPPLTPEPRRPLWGSCGQARACPRGARRPAADHGGCAGQAAGVGCAAARRRKTWRAMLALEDAHDFFGCSAFGSASGQVVTGCLVVAHPHQHDRGQYPVQLSVASPVQPISDGVA